MLELVCYLFPACISLQIYRHIISPDPSETPEHQHKHCRPHLFAAYGIFVALDNFAALATIFAVHPGAEEIIYNPYDLSYLFKYMSVALAASLLTPLIVKYISRNFGLDVEVLPRKKKSKRH